MLPGISLSRPKGGAAGKPPPAPKAGAGSKSAGVGKLVGGIPKTFEGAPKLEQTNARAPLPKAAPEHHSLISLHTLGEGVSDVGKGISGALKDTYGTASPKGKGSSAATIMAPGAAIAGPNALTNKATAVSNALVNNPGGMVGHTIQSIPGTLNAVVMGPARIVGEEGAALVKSAEAHALGNPLGKEPASVFGIKAGKPGEALAELPASIAKQYKEQYGGTVAEMQKNAETKGVAPELVEAALMVGGAGHIIGDRVTDAVGKSDTLKTAAAKVSAYNDARVRAYQSPSVQEFLAKRDEMPAAPSKREVRQAKAYESTQPRPNLRTASGDEPVSQKGAVRPQVRSGNFFRAYGETTLDNARRDAQVKSLQRVVEARKAIADHPYLSHDELPQTFASQLAYDTKRGEVAPLLQRGEKAGTRFLGAERSQRIGSAYQHGENVRGRRGTADAYTHEYKGLLKGASKQQKAVLDWAKEGLLNLNDPAKAHEQLQEIHDQAAAGADRLRLPLQTVRKGADAVRESGAVLEHIDKHGADSVFTPDFAKLVETIPDERLVAHQNPVLREQPDEAIARKYLPQQHFLGQWAERHPDHLDAPATKAAVEQVHQLLQEGKDLRAQALAADNPDLHSEATDKFASAKNLADENARQHGLPTDRAYIQHTTTLDRETGMHVVKSRAPGDYKKWEGRLQKAGVLSRDPELPLRALQRSLRDIYSQKDVNEFKARFAVKLPRTDMTPREVHDWLAASGRNPEDFQVVHLGKVREALVDRASAEQLTQLDSDPEAHAAAVERIWHEAAANPSDTTKGADAVNRAAWDEKTASFKQGGAMQRAGAKAKGEVSKLMLGLSPKWAATMGLVTYPVQFLMAGGSPFDALATWKDYRAKSPADKAAFDQAFGVDSPYQTASHGVTSERMGNALPAKLDDLMRVMEVAKNSPTGKLLSKANPVKAIMGLERIPRRGARIGAAYKGLKTEAIRQMLSDMHDGQQAINKFELATHKLMMTGKLPQQEFMDRAMGNAKLVEQLAEHLNKAMGEWHNMTNFERTKVNKVVMFYPWVRYSMKLVTHTLPRDHPLLMASALTLGNWEHHSLVELLGTEPEPGTVYLNKAQPNVPPEQRQWTDISLKQANPTLNAAVSALTEGPNALLNMLPPYYSSLLGWAVGKNLFTDKPLKGAKYGESKESKENKWAQLLPFMAHEAEQTFAPTRAASRLITGGRPQSSVSLPLLGLEKPVQYSAKTERLIQKEQAEQGSPFSKLASEILPLPHSDEGRLASKIRTEAEQKKEAAKNLRKEEGRRGALGSLNSW